MKNNIENQYLKLLKDILDNGVEKQDRTGTGTISVFGRQIRHKMSGGFPILTTKKMYFKGIVTELLWFLRGDTNIKYLVDNDCHIWDGDAFKNYLNTYKGNFPMDKDEFIEAIKTNPEFAEKWGELGPIYGKQWRSWKSFKVKPGIVNLPNGLYNENYWDIDKNIDQIQNLINDLKTNPDSRRLMVNAWNVGELDSMVLPPCHYGFQVYTRELSLEEKCEWLNKNYTMYELGEWTLEKLSDSDYLEEVEVEYNIPTRAISLSWNQRSVDAFLGLPFNISSYALLLRIIAKEVNMVPDELIGNLGDVHLYKNHIEQAKEQMTREPMELPQLDIHPGILDYDMEKYEIGMFTIKNYQSHPHIKAPLSN
jgi:thymidylate synthase